MEEREIVDIDEMENKEEHNVLDNEKGFSMAYNLTMISAIATVVMFVIGTALYLTVVLG